MCFALAKECGKWPHEVLLARNDAPGPFEMALLVFDFQAMNMYHEAVAEANRKQKR